MKRVESKVSDYRANWKKISHCEEQSAILSGRCGILIGHVHDRKGALYKGGTGVNLTGDGLTRM